MRIIPDRIGWYNYADKFIVDVSVPLKPLILISHAYHLFRLKGVPKENALTIIGEWVDFCSTDADFYTCFLLHFSDITMEINSKKIRNA